MSTPSRKPDFTLGPLFVVGLGVPAAARGRTVVTEFAWPNYRRFKRRADVPLLLAYNREGARA